MVASATSTFPSSLDAPQAPTQYDNLDTNNVEHDILHAWAQDAIKKIETKLGMDASPLTSTVDYVLHHHQHQGTDGSPKFAQVPIVMASSQIADAVSVTDFGGNLLSSITYKGEFLSQSNLTADLAVRTKLIADTYDRFTIGKDGAHKWGAGSGATDTTLARTAIGQLSLTGGLAVSGAFSAASAAVSGAFSAASLSLTTPLPIGSGGTGSTTKNFVDLTTAQTIGGTKTFSVAPIFSAPLAIASGGTGSATQNFVDLTTAQMVAGLKAFSSGIDVTGSPSGYESELRSNVATASPTLALSTLGTTTPSINMDHRGTGNAGQWLWRNGTGAATTRMTLTGAGHLVLTSDVTTSLATGAVNGLAMWGTGIVYQADGVAPQGGVTAGIAVAINRAAPAATLTNGSGDTLQLYGSGYSLREQHRLDGTTTVNVNAGGSISANGFEVWASPNTGGWGALYVHSNWGTGQGGNLIRTANTVGDLFCADAYGRITFGQGSVTAGIFGTTATAGGASALPGNPVGYMQINVNGTTYKIPYYGA